MRFKLDEHMGETLAVVARDRGHDVETVLDESLCGCEDGRLLKICAEERRTFTTLDKEFGNPLLFPPSQYSGVVLLRVPKPCGFLELKNALEAFLVACEPYKAMACLAGRLWVVSRERIREYTPVPDTDPEKESPDHG